MTQQISKKDKEALAEIVERNNEEVRALNLQLTQSSSKKHSRRSKAIPKVHNDKKGITNPSEKFRVIKEIRAENQTYMNQSEFMSLL